MSKKYLQEGDIFRLEAGHEIYVSLPEHFIYDNRQFVFDKLGSTTIKIGEPKRGFDTSCFAGEYVVVKTTFDGGGTGHGDHDVYPDGHHIHARKIVENELKGEKEVSNFEIEFYQSGCFTAMNEKIKAIGKAKSVWVLRPVK